MTPPLVTTTATSGPTELFARQRVLNARVVYDGQGILQDVTETWDWELNACTRERNHTSANP